MMPALDTLITGGLVAVAFWVLWRTSRRPGTRSGCAGCDHSEGCS